MKILLVPFLLFVNFIFAQSETEKKFLEVTDFTVTGHPKQYIKVKLYLEDAYYKQFELYIEPVSKYGAFDITKRNAGLTGTVSRNGSVDLTNKIEYDLDYKYGYDNQKLETVQYGPFDWWSPVEYIRISFVQEDILNHSRLTVIGKIKGRPVVVTINLNNKELHQYVKKSLEPTKEELEAKAKLIAKEIAKQDSIKKADEEFKLKYGYLFTGTGKPDKFTLNNIDDFIANFNHGNKIPEDAVFYYNYQQFWNGYNRIILKTNKPAVFYKISVNDSEKLGVLPKGKLVELEVNGINWHRNGGKKYVMVELDFNDPWWKLCHKQEYWFGMGYILMEDLEFGNASDLENFKAQQKEFKSIQIHGFKENEIKILCEEIAPKN